MCVECSGDCVRCVMLRRLEKEQFERSSGPAGFLMGLGSGVLIEYA